MKRKGLKCLVSSMIAIVIALTFISFVPMASCKDVLTVSQIMEWEKILVDKKVTPCGIWVVYLNPKSGPRVGYVHYHGPIPVQYGYRVKGEEVRVFTYKDGKWQECAGHSHLAIDRWLDKALEKQSV